MPILNYTTTVAAHKTVGEIQNILVKKGAVSLNMEFGAEGVPVALTFNVKAAAALISQGSPNA